MQIYQIMGNYISDRYNDRYTSHVWTDNTVYADRLAADMTVDLLNLIAQSTDEYVDDLSMHGDDAVESYYVQESAA